MGVICPVKGKNNCRIETTLGFNAPPIRCFYALTLCALQIVITITIQPIGLYWNVDYRLLIIVEVGLCIISSSKVTVKSI